MSDDEDYGHIKLTRALEEFGRGFNEDGLSDISDEENVIESRPTTERAKRYSSGEWANAGLLPSWDRIQVVLRNAPYQFMTGLRRELEDPSKDYDTPVHVNHTEEEEPTDDGDDEEEDEEDDEEDDEGGNDDDDDDDEEGEEDMDSNDEDWENLNKLPTFIKLQDSLRNASEVISNSLNRSELFSKFAPPSSGISWSSFTHNIPLAFHEEEQLDSESPEFKKLCSTDGLTDKDVEVTYNSEGLTGCEHYLRSCKAECFTCHRFYPCQLCHNDAEFHEMVRTETRRMLCLHCKRPQPPGRTCHFCNEVMGDYYCGKCKLWSDDPDKPIYHCDKCGICRVGHGLGIDVFHCDTCGICMSLTIENSHRCIEQLGNSSCPICLEDLFSSTKTVVFMPCGHPIHADCFDEYSKRFYRCPLCSKSILNTTALFRMIDEEAKNEVLPPELADLQVDIVCQDCRLRSKTKFHLVGLKCETCGSYNTTKF